MSRLLVVEDDPDIALALRLLFSRAGYEVAHAGDGRTGLKEAYAEHPDLVVLDVGLPEMDGWQVLERLRDVSDVPVLVLTAHGQEAEKVRGLRGGADDYLVKPPRIAELMARIETVTRRAAVAAAGSSPVVTTGDVRVDLAARTVEVGGEPVALTQKEFELVEALVERPGSAVSRQQLMDRIWGDAFVAVSRTLDVHMTGLRAKLNRPGLISTIRGYGYRWGS
jgi:DNA-binding response OmpR family regulator